ncbi:hypothetical protein [Actinoallomurus acaciae]|uniref:Uncharacterized protein n=1 Tax=Actinoallomurus acaciae TaxID=502577 RepID=A0ABV5YA90_9ACTN
MVARLRLKLVDDVRPTRGRGRLGFGRRLAAAHEGDDHAENRGDGERPVRRAKSSAITAGADRVPYVTATRIALRPVAKMS